MDAHFEKFPAKPKVDSTGIYFTPNLRHLDRGSLEVDNGHYLNYEYVFGATAAAALYRREMIDDILGGRGIFRRRLLCLPRRRRCRMAGATDGLEMPLRPVCEGVSRPQRAAGNRRALPPEINMHSVKNRFLLRMKNMTGHLYRRNFFSITVRDLVVVSCCVLWEHSSLKAFRSCSGTGANHGETRRDHAPPASQRRIYCQLVRFQTRKQACTQKSCRRCWRDRKRHAGDFRCGSHYWEHAEFRQVTADLKLSRKKFPQG